jgi:radical SAM family uncharacterized protein
MAHLGYQILYSIINGLDWAAAERAYAPWPDMQREMRSRGIPLYALESFRPVRQFDAVGFSLQSEMLLTNVLMMLELAGVAVESAERSEDDPIVIAGGPGAFAPEPMADFIDLFFVGDGEETVVRFAEQLRAMKADRATREQIVLEAARRIPGVYAPAFYEPRYDAHGLLQGTFPTRDGLPERIRAARVDVLDNAPFPTAPVIPFVETVHDRITLEIMRGCSRGCRFCHAGMTGRPVRHRSPEKLFELAVESYGKTGHNEIALASLSSSDYPHLKELLDRLTTHFNPLAVNVSLPSLRVSDQLQCLVGPLSGVRKSGLTLAPEAATERLRNVINKDITTAELLDGTRAAAEQGWRRVKLYFMIGLPTETPEDVRAIGEMCRQVLRNATPPGKRCPLQLAVTVSPFVPKPHTPFQWEPMAPPSQMREKGARVREGSHGRKIEFKVHDVRRALVEAVLARGDRRLGGAIREVWERGGQFDGWDEHFRYDLWAAAFEECGVPLGENAQELAPGSPNSPFRARSPEEALPWDHIDCGVRKEFLLAERERALSGQLTEDCRVGECARCGACPRAEK